MIDWCVNDKLACKLDNELDDEWRGSGSHTTLEGKIEWTPFTVLWVILIKKYAKIYAKSNVV